jgi:hypothetical protein
MPVAEPAREQIDDSLAYRVSGAGERKCPECRQLLDNEATVCPACRFNLETRKKARKVYEELHRSWEAGLTLRQRRTVFITIEAVLVPVVLVGIFLNGEVFAFLMPWLLFTGLAAFILGTFDRLDLTRDGRGRVRLTQTWRAFFFLRPTENIRLAEYEGVTTGPADRASCLDWLVFMFLLPAGIIPAGLWWYLAIHQDAFFVALLKDHGYPERILYQGRNKGQAHEIARVLRDVTGWA